jgi:hypothetical protein
MRHLMDFANMYKQVHVLKYPAKRICYNSLSAVYVMVLCMIVVVMRTLPESTKHVVPHEAAPQEPAGTLHIGSEVETAQYTLTRSTVERCCCFWPCHCWCRGWLCAAVTAAVVGGQKHTHSHPACAILLFLLQQSLLIWLDKRCSAL